MEALAAENAARVAATTGALSNIDQRLEDLSETERRLRQEAITAELPETAKAAEQILHPRGDDAAEGATASLRSPAP